MAKAKAKTVEAYVVALLAGEELTSGEILVLTRMLNGTSSYLEADKLLQAAHNCHCKTPKGILVGFEAVISMIYGDIRFKPIYKREIA